MGRGNQWLSFILVLHSISLQNIQAHSLHKLTQNDFILRWKENNKTIYTGESLEELLAMCPDGCGADCSSFPVVLPPDKNGVAPPPAQAPCTETDIKILRKAQGLVQGWKELKELAAAEVLIHSVFSVLIVFLIIVLFIRGHYRIRDLWFLPTDMQWDLENDPTWGLPGKVWGLLQIRVVKSDKNNSKPTERKYGSYTANPITLGDKFWYYKQTLRDMYKTHKYYKHDRYFQKLAWQISKLGKIIPETLRRGLGNKRRAGELEEQRSNASSDEVDPQENMPWEIDLADEMNLEMLRDAKSKVEFDIDRAKDDGHFMNGRFQNPEQQQHQHHHHHHHAQQIVPPLTKEEVLNSARQLEVDPNADCVNVDGVMRRNPASVKPGEKVHRRHHHHQNHRSHSQRGNRR